MNTVALIALKKSIKHWERLSTGRRRIGEHAGASGCALCQEFLPGCGGCPVAEKTGKRHCFGTPYTEAVRLILDTADYDSIEFKRAAGKELAFLKSLLPKPKKKGQTK